MSSVSQLRVVPLAAIRPSRIQPRSDAASHVESMKPSIGSPDDPRVVQPPILHEIRKGEYEIIAGEVRVLTAQAAGFIELACLVHPKQDAVEAQWMRFVENHYRHEVNPLDEAATLKMLYLTANVESMELGQEARAILEKGKSVSAVNAELEKLLARHQFNPKKPPVTWAAFLDGRGLALGKEARRKLMKVLALSPEAQRIARVLPGMTEAGLRSVAQLAPDDQEVLLKEASTDPRVAKRVRRCVSAVKKGSSLGEAIAECKGKPVEPVMSLAPINAEDAPPVAEEVGDTDAAMAILDQASAVSSAWQSFAAAAQATSESLATIDVSALGVEWRGYVRDAAQAAAAEIDLKTIGDIKKKLEAFQ
jgi:hypothetical protein